MTGKVAHAEVAVDDEDRDGGQRTHRVRRDILGVTMVAGLAAVLEAMLDAAAASARLQGMSSPGRFAWVLGFSVGALTMGVAAAGWTARPALSRWIAPAAAGVAAANVAASVVDVVAHESWALAALHLIAAALLVALAADERKLRQESSP